MITIKVGILIEAFESGVYELNPDSPVSRSTLVENRTPHWKARGLLKWMRVIN